MCIVNLTSVIKNSDILYGNDLQIIKNGLIIVNNKGIIEKVGKTLEIIEKKDTNVIDAKGYLIIPGLVNSHIHIGDAIGKDISSSDDLDTRVHPNHSIKKTILEKTEPDQLKQFMKNAAISMLNKGITTFVDFREGGICGINMLQTAIKDIPIKSFILGRFDFNCFYNVQNDKKVLIKSNNPHNNITKHHNETKEKEILKLGKNLLDSCNGFGISGANENEDNILKI